MLRGTYETHSGMRSAILYGLFLLAISIHDVAKTTMNEGRLELAAWLIIGMLIIDVLEFIIKIREKIKQL